VVLCGLTFLVLENGFFDLCMFVERLYQKIY
jgi:hypothetical protein